MAVEGAPAVASGAGAPAALVRALQRVLDSGTGDAVDIKEGGRIRLVNEVAVFVAALLVPYAGVFVLIHGWRNAAIQVIAIVALLGVVVLSRWPGSPPSSTSTPVRVPASTPDRSRRSMSHE